uniref:Uncharacterized protein n=1 Tax=Rhizophora mucronata TaxID=61149 RepID=A0A2P2IUS6_RHIMU
MHVFCHYDIELRASLLENETLRPAFFKA